MTDALQAWDPVTKQYKDVVLGPGGGVLTEAVGGGGGGGDASAANQTLELAASAADAALQVDILLTLETSAIDIAAARVAAEATSAGVGATTDADTSMSLVGRLKNLLSRTPAALVNNRLDVNVGNTVTSRASADGTNFVAGGLLSAGMATTNYVAQCAGAVFGRVFGTQTWTPLTLDSIGRTVAVGAGAAGATIAGDPVRMGAQNASNTVNVQADIVGRLIVIGNRVGRAAHLTSAALPAAGAYTVQAAYAVPEGVVGIAAYITYTRGAAGGQVVLRPQWGNGTETAREFAVVSNADALGTVRQTVSLRETVLPVVGTASPVSVVYEFAVPPGATAFTLLAAELGVPATPGTCAITLTAKYGAA